MSEQDGPAAPAVLAAEDQAVASARHLASCVGRHYRELKDQRVPRFERFVFTAIWLHWFAAPDDGEDDE